jgi:glycosyltransferase involved in cell wall biosynthesis
MIHVVHPTGNSFVRALLQSLETNGADFRFWTTIASSSPTLKRLLPDRLNAHLARRSFPVPMDKVLTRPLREWVRLLAAAMGLTQLSSHEHGWASVDAVYQDLDRAVARFLLSQAYGSHPNSWVYAYEDGALECFRAAVDVGFHRAYELPIVYWETSRRLLAEEAERWPDWAATLVGPKDSASKLERKTRELELAEVIIVPSRFVERSLPDWLKPEQRVVVAEFGSPLLNEVQKRELMKRNGSRLRVLFAGSMTQRKGLADVFEAMRLLNRNDIELVAMGTPVVEMDFYLKQKIPFSYQATRPHAEVLELMRSCDVLVLPSIVEGRALVQQEALACGLPIIVTANAGGEELVVEGETGFLVAMRSPNAIAEKIAWFADQRGSLEEMRPLCQAKAAEYTWTRYAEKILGSIRDWPSAL